jgi:uncharacterized protein (DUF2147 family)
MRKALLIAALMMTTGIGVAHAGDTWSFNINGKKVSIERPRNCTTLSCLNVVAPGLNNSSSDDTPAPSSTVSNLPAKTNQPQINQPVAAAPVQQAPTQQPIAAAPAVAAPVTAPLATVPPLPGQTTTNANVTTLPAPTSSQTSVAAPATTVPALPPVAQPVQQQVATVTPAQTVAPAQVASGPLGMWMTEKNEGKLHVINCGSNICGYAVDKNGADGAQVLIDMKPDGKDGWKGRIHDTRGGGTYDSTLAMRGNNNMRVQGCAFGGMFCGGQTWTRVN